MSDLKRTPLYETYQTYAKCIPFAGWNMPVNFSNILLEHKAVRESAGLFDVSHMGEIEIAGPDALRMVQKLTTNDARKLEVGDAQYTFMCFPNGGTVDDLLVYRTGEETYLLVVNASNIDKDFVWIKQHEEGEVTVANRSDELAQIAIQGPKAEYILQKITEEDLTAIKLFRFKNDAKISGITALISRTGYTGEDGFEIYLAANEAIELWTKLLEVGKADGLLPCGLGARDTLRFEAKLPLYGQELSDTISPLEAGLGFAVKLDKGDFIGRDTLVKQKEEGPKRKLMGIEMIDRGIPRTGYPVLANGEKVGEVTTGTQSPTLKKNIGLALIATPQAIIGQEVSVVIRDKPLRGVIVKTPFYRRERKG